MHRNRYLHVLFTIISLLSVSFLLKFFMPVKSQKINYIKVANIKQINEIWRNYHNQVLSNDVQITRSLSPFNEGNLVVNDEENIYSIVNNKVVKTNINNLETVKEINYQEEKPLQLYVTDDKLVVICEVNKQTKVYIYDKNTFEEFKNFSIDSVYITSRLINNELYVITSKIIENNTNQRPIYSENGVEKTIPYGNIIYVENTYSNNYVNIIKTNINNKENLKIKSYLGLGQVIYFSKDNIYLAEEKYAKELGTSNKTIIIKINNKNLNLSGVQEVTGYVLDKDSLNEYRENLRVATTNHNQKGNNIYVLNKKMKIIGKLENFSLGQEIQAVIFIKDKAYVETFNILDPFYIIDLKKERKPKIISEIKFPGYNTNFIPYDKNNIIAFGLILDDHKQPIGLKVSLYDVSNPKKVKIKAQTNFMYEEYNSAYSEVLYDCRSLLIDKENNIIGFPIIYWINDKEKPAYYKQFYAVYKINDEFKQLGKISHYGLSKENGSNDIKRGLIINDYLYTVSDRLIQKHDIKNLKLVNKSYFS